MNTAFPPASPPSRSSRAALCGLAASLALLLSGCGGVSQVTTAKGGAYRADCGGPFSTKLDCNVRANQMCPSGFDPISSPPGELVFTCSRREVPKQAGPN